MNKQRVLKLEKAMGVKDLGLWVIRPSEYYYGDLESPFWTSDEPMTLSEHIDGKEYTKAEHPVHGWKVPTGVFK